MIQFRKKNNLKNNEDSNSLSGSIPTEIGFLGALSRLSLREFSSAWISIFWMFFTTKVLPN